MRTHRGDHRAGRQQATLESFTQAMSPPQPRSPALPCSCANHGHYLSFHKKSFLPQSTDRQPFGNTNIHKDVFRRNKPDCERTLQRDMVIEISNETVTYIFD